MTNDKGQKTKNTLKNLLKIIVSLILIYIILRSIDLDKLGGVLLNASPAWLGVSVVLVLAGVVIRAWRWKILLDDLQFTVSFNELTQIYFIGFLFNNLLPTGLGGDAIRIIELNRHPGRTSDAVTSVLVDRFLGLFGALTLALIALIFRWDVVPPQVAIISLVIFGGMLAGGLLLINKPLYETMQKIRLFQLLTTIKFVNNLFESFQTYNLLALGKSFLVSIGFNIILIATNATIGLALGAQISLVHYLVFVPIASMVLVLPISFAGFGVREGAYITLFAQVGVAEEVSLGISLLVYFLGNVVTGLIGGVIYLWRGAKGWQLETSEIGD